MAAGQASGLGKGDETALRRVWGGIHGPPRFTPGLYVNIWSDDWGEQPEDWSGGGGLAKRLVPGGGPFLGASLYELGPGNFMIFHFHHGSEELLIVLRGTPTLRTMDGERVLEEGEVVHFPTGPDGAHEIRNDTDTAVRYVVAGTRVSPEVVEYPDRKQATGQSKHGIFFIHDLTSPD